jgi:AcrR family transcriptional regulator
MDVVRECEAARDPRIRRTRHGLQEALRKLLEIRSFEQISVLEIAEQAQVNRATFYDHYPDKFALLESLVAARFYGLLEARQIRFDGTCPTALIGLVGAVCDFVTTDTSFQPLVESAVISLIRKVISDGPHTVPELAAAASSWAIYGAVQAWASMPDRVPAEDVSQQIMLLVAPMLGFHAPPAEPQTLVK